MAISETNKELIDIFIISYNTSRLTAECVESVFKRKSSLDFRVFVIDNASNDDTVRVIKENFKNVTVIQNEQNLGYAKAVNIAGKLASGDYFIVANSDVVFFENTVDELFQILKKDSNVAVCCCQQVYPNGKWQSSYRLYPGILLAVCKLFFIDNSYNFLKNFLYKLGIYRKGEINLKYHYADGALLAFNRSAFEKIGRFDENFFFYSEEMDFCKRAIKNGFKVVFTNRTKIIHYRGGSSTYQTYEQKFYDLLVDSKIKYCDKHLNFFVKKFYFFSEKYNSYCLYIVFSMMNLIFFGKIRFIKEKRNNYKNYFLAWKILLKK